MCDDSNKYSIKEFAVVFVKAGPAPRRLHLNDLNASVNYGENSKRWASFSLGVLLYSSQCKCDEEPCKPNDEKSVVTYTSILYIRV